MIEAIIGGVVALVCVAAVFVVFTLWLAHSLGGK